MERYQLPLCCYIYFMNNFAILYKVKAFGFPRFPVRFNVCSFKSAYWVFLNAQKKVA